MITTLDVDDSLYERYGSVCGVDEAGRGPLAGPVYAAAVILPRGCDIAGLNDSKKLSEKKRNILFDNIREIAIAYSIAFATAEEIDRLNILSATFLAMNRAIEGLSPSPAFALVDGNRSNGIILECRPVTGGDGIYSCIAAASILAKVSRDRYMERLDCEYPQYGFKKHKGYGTKLHYEKLKEFGACPIHRKSFLRNLEAGN